AALIRGGDVHLVVAIHAARLLLVVDEPVLVVLGLSGVLHARPETRRRRRRGHVDRAELRAERDLALGDRAEEDAGAPELAERQRGRARREREPVQVAGL